ncbi:hypothetical protein [Micromonospora sp. NPDC004704]
MTDTAVILQDLLDRRLTAAEGLRLLGVRQRLVQAIRQAVADGDTDVLTRVWQDSSRLHRSMPAGAQYAVDDDALAEPYRQGQPPTAHALRALAALGLAVLSDDDEQAVECVRGAESWLAVSGLCPPGPLTTEAPDQQQVAMLRAGLGVAEDSRIARLLEPGTLRDPVRLTALIWLLDLAGRLPARRSGAGCGVLFDDGRDGVRGTLTLTPVAGLPPILAPDPAMMALCSADSAFRQMLGNVWALAARAPGAVLWSVSTDGRPITRIAGPSIGGAFAVLHREVQPRRWQRIRPGFLVRRERTLIVGAISQSLPDRLLTVDGYEKKLKAVDRRDRLIVPDDDNERAHQAAVAAGVRPTIRPARTLDQAAWRSRVPQIRHVLTALAAVATVVAVLAGYQVLVASKENERNRLEALAEKVGQAARRSSGTDGQDMLLAMASDDIAARAGRRGTLFDELSQERGSLLKIFRSDAGAFRHAALSGSGDLAVLTGDAGTIRVVDTGLREIVWSRNLPPGTMSSPDQAHVMSSAVSDTGVVVIALSTNKILVLRRKGLTWPKEPQSITVPSDDRSGLFGSHAMTDMAIDDDGTYLYTSGSDGIRRVSLGSEPAVDRCADVRAVRAIEANDDGVVLTLPDRVVAVAFPGCQMKTLLRAPTGVTLHGSAVMTTEGESGQRVAVGTTGTALVTVNSQGVRSTIAANGPYEPRISHIRWTLQVSAVDSRAGDSVLWDVENGKETLRTRGIGEIWSAGTELVWIHDGIAELHSAGLGTFLTLRVIDDFPSRKVQWAGPHLLIADFRGPYLLRSAATKPFLQGRVDLPAPEKSSVVTLAGDDAGRWGAGIFQDTGESPVMRLRAWDLNGRREMPLPVVRGDFATSIEFVGDRLLVGYGSGAIRTFRVAEGAWVPQSQARLTGPVLDVTPTHDGRAVAGIAMDASRTSMHAFVLDIETMRRRATRALESTVGSGHVVVLRDGRIVAAYGSGNVTFMEPDLTVIRSFHEPEAVYLNAAAEVPERSEVIIGTRAGSLVYDTFTYAKKSSDDWGHAGVIGDLDATAAGDYLATVRGGGVFSDVAVWSTAPDGRRANACAAIGRDLTRDEWAEYVGPALEYERVC